MKNKKWLWRIIALVLIVVTVGVSVGSCYHAKNKDKNNDSDTVQQVDDTHFEVSFDSSEEGVWVPDTMILEKGTKIYTITTPQKDGCIFLGWYYDGDFTELVDEEDTVEKSMTLYPRFTSQAGNEDTNVHMDYVASTDVATDFSITINAYNLTEEEVKSLLKVTNLTTDEEVSYVLESVSSEEVENSTQYTLKPATGGWNAGTLHQVEISDASNLRYVYLDQEMDSQVVYYNFTVYEAEIDNLELSDEVIFIPASEVTGVDLTKGMYNVTTDANGEYAAERNNQSGEITYTGSKAIHKGNYLAIYDGTLNDDKTVDGKVTYVTVTTEPSGNKFSYVASEYDEVIKKSDVIPVKDDGTFDDGKIIIPSEELKFDTAFYTELGLNSDTTVDVGDFIAVYTGDVEDEANMTMVGYGCITETENVTAGLQVEYNIVEYSDIDSSMDLYMVDNDPDFDISDADLESYAADIEESVNDSEYFEDLGEEVGELVTDTDFDIENSSYKDILEQAKFTDENGDEMSLAEVRKVASGGKVTVKNPKVSAMLTTKLDHFSGKKGIRGEISASMEIEINLNETGSKQNKLVITLTAALEQEVALGMKIKTKTIWKKKWIFPYIADIQVTAGLTAGTFTGFGLYAQAKTTSESKNSDKSWSSLLDTSNKGLDMSNSKVKNVTGTISTLSGKLDGISDALKLSNGYGVSKDKKGTTSGASESASAGAGGGLMDKYSAMLANDAQYVRLVEKTIFDTEMSPDPLHLVSFGIKINLVVSLKVNAMIGFTISYGNAKQLDYTFSVKSGKVTRSEADLETPNFRLDFYVFGMIGIRAGVEFDIRAGLISTKLDSIGIKLEAGLYIEFYGFFYVALAWESGKGTSTEMYGSMLLETGIYFTVNFYAQLGNGKLGTTKLLYSLKKPLFKVGTKVFPMDFNIASNDKALTLTASANNDVTVPASLYKIKGMDVSTGKSSTFNIGGGDVVAVSSKSNVNYDSTTKKISFTPSADDYKKGSCSFKVVLKYKNKAFGINSDTISRTVTINWKAPTVKINLCDGKNTLYSFTTTAGKAPSKTADQLLDEFRKKNPGKDIESIYWTTQYTLGGKNTCKYISYKYLAQAFYSNTNIQIKVKNITYTVQYYIDGTLADTKSNLAYNSKLPDAPTLNEEHYKLSDWTDENGKTIDYANMVLNGTNTTIKLYATKEADHEHEWSEETVTTEATCKHTGVSERTCTICGEKETTEIQVDPDNHSDAHVVSGQVEATCSKEGYTGDVKCADCNAVIEKGTVIPVDETKHKTVLKNVVEKTCTKDGYTGDEVCIYCGKTISTGSVIAKGHDWDAGTYHKMSYTEGEYGACENIKAPYTEYTCKTCGTKRTEVNKIKCVIYGSESYCSELLTNNMLASVEELDGEASFLWASIYVGGSDFENRQDIEGTFSFLEDYSYLTPDYFETNKKDVVLKIRFTPSDTTNFETFDFTVTFKYGSLPETEGMTAIGDLIVY